MKTFGLTVALLTALAGTAAAQSASVTVFSSAATVAPGGTVSITLAVDFDTGGAGGGLFGAAGLYGFGGNMTVAGDGSADVGGSNIAVDAQLAFGQTAATPGGGVLVRAGGGRGFDGGLSGSPKDVLTFDLTADAGATAGTSVTIDFDGAVVLVEGSDLVTYATVPGLNQATLPTTSVTITIGSAGCNAADISAPYGLLDLADINTFISGFLTQDPVSDIDGNGLHDLADINLFISAFLAGCP
ncbi:MAG: hypothetical protein H6810_02360 [Phycisphaeraceae bacterium]|nr:MAG: hypothetical protein H6810_02360 [Phycisphaeraceae bacterium]